MKYELIILIKSISFNKWLADEKLLTNTVAKFVSTATKILSKKEGLLFHWESIEADNYQLLASIKNIELVSNKDWKVFKLNKLTEEIESTGDWENNPFAIKLVQRFDIT